ncbi:hypothetical protein Pth03_32920 [Planotetraspora thailandica]|uniref:Uncharacterized protein n=1 Tax=Planotetraspora thailandica TaxID=487172 RepID=A0A8J3XYS2_9ACTN|nr:hypothetical protein Pth03_32920 [Planotetraspora thailandica]
MASVYVQVLSAAQPIRGLEQAIRLANKRASPQVIAPSPPAPCRERYEQHGVDLSAQHTEANRTIANAENGKIPEVLPPEASGV